MIANEQDIEEDNSLIKSYPKMEKIFVPITREDRSSSLCSDDFVIDNTLQNLKAQLNVKEMDQSK
jgi:hypothetical protein